MLCRAIRGKKKRDPADGAEECAGTLLDQLLQRTAKSIPVVSRCRTRCARRVPFCWVPPMVAKGVGPEERYDVSTGCMHQRDGTCAAMHVMHEIDRCSVSLFCLGVLCRCSVSVFCVGVLGRSRMLATIRSRRNDGGFHRTDPLIRTPVNTADADESLRTRRIRYPDFSLDWLPVWRAVCLLAVFSLASRTRAPFRWRTRATTLQQPRPRQSSTNCARAHAEPPESPAPSCSNRSPYVSQTRGFRSSAQFPFEP
jgi:hypothetical protein